MKFIKFIGDIINQTKTQKLKQKELLIKLEELKISAKQFEQEMKVKRANSSTLVAKQIADYRIQVMECNDCNEEFEKCWQEAFNSFEKIGSVLQQLQRRERIIIRDPDKELRALKEGNHLPVCKKHRNIPIIIKELYRVNNK